MGVPLDVIVDIGAVLLKHGVKALDNDDLNAIIRILTPYFERK